MKRAADFRLTARNHLRGKWVIAIIAALVAAWLGGIDAGGLEVKLQLNEGAFQIGLNSAGQNIISTDGTQIFWPTFASIAAGVGFMAIVVEIALFFIGAIIEVGYASFNLYLVDDEKTAEMGDLFNYFTYWKSVVCTRLLKSVYILLWSLLLFIPGIIASFNYAMTSYILAENPELKANEAIARSKQLMYGNRWRLFCLEFSFIGWDLLCILTMGIGNLWLNPYKQAAIAAFYQEISGGKVHIGEDYVG